MAGVLAAAAVVPDLDLLLGEHREWSHSVGAALLAGAIVWLIVRRWRWGAAVALAWASHVLLDWLSNDTRPPIGVMAFWPFTREYYKASIEIFPAVSRTCCGARFWKYNVRAVAIEAAVMGPLAALVVWWHSRHRRA